MSSFRVFSRLFLPALLLMLVQANAFSGLMFSFSADNESIRVGDTIDVRVFLNQTDASAPVDISSIGITGVEIKLGLDSMAAEVTDLRFGAGFDDLFGFSDVSDPFNPILSILSIDPNGVLAPNGVPASIEIGAFTFAGKSIGMTTVTNLDEPGMTQLSFDGISTDLDDQVFRGETFTISVSAVPEPNSLMFLLGTGAIGLTSRGRKVVRDQPISIG